MNNKLLNLIKEMSFSECDFSNKSDFFSIKERAYKKARKQSNIDYVSELFDYVNNEKKTIYRESAFFIAGSILKKNNNIYLTQKFIDYLEIEKSNTVITTILEGLDEIKLPEPYDVNPILNLINNKSWKIRHSAIIALSNSSQDVVRETLRNIVQKQTMRKDQDDIVYAIAAIGKIGNDSDLPILQKMLSSENTDIKESAEYAIHAILCR